MRMVANSLHLPMPDAVSLKLDLPVKLMIPRPLFGTAAGKGADYVMLGA